MSAIADFRLFETSRLNDLRDNAEIKSGGGLYGKGAKDAYDEYLNSNSKRLKDFEYSGYVFADLLVFLAENKGIDLLKSKYDDIANAIMDKRQNSTIILTYEHRQSYLDKLTADKFTADELIAFNKEFSENDDPELAIAEIEGIKALHDSLYQLAGDEQVVLLTVG